MYHPTFEQMLEAMGFGYCVRDGQVTSIMGREFTPAIMETFRSKVGAIQGLSRYLHYYIDETGREFVYADFGTPQKTMHDGKEFTGTLEAFYKATQQANARRYDKLEAIANSAQAECLLRRLLGQSLGELKAVTLGELNEHDSGAPLNFPGRMTIEDNFRFAINPEDRLTLMRKIQSLGLNSYPHYFDIQNGDTLFIRTEVAKLLPLMEKLLLPENRDKHCLGTYTGRIMEMECNDPSPGKRVA